MRRGQCVSSCGDGFFQDRHSCAGKPGPATEKATLTSERSEAARSCAQLFKSERKLSQTPEGPRTTEERDDACFYNLVSALVMCRVW